jgi:hypothetical protein
MNDRCEPAAGDPGLADVNPGAMNRGGPVPDVDPAALRRPHRPWTPAR